MHKRVPTSRRKRRRRSLSSSSSYKLYSSSSSSYKLYSSSSSSYKLRSHFPTLTDIHPSVSSPAPHPALIPSLPFAVAPPHGASYGNPEILTFFFCSPCGTGFDNSEILKKSDWKPCKVRDTWGFPSLFSKMFDCQSKRTSPVKAKKKKKMNPKLVERGFV
jgi:hypothetical protein